MPVQDVYTLDKITFPSSVEIHTLSNVGTRFGIRSFLGKAAGQLYPNFVATERQQPQIEFTSKQIDVLLAACGVGGVAYTSPTTCYLKRRNSTGYQSRASTVHKKSVLNSSLVYWTSLRLSHAGEAELNVTVMANYDGTNDPIITTASVALSGNLTASNYFGLGPSYINTVLVPGVQEITVNNQVRLIQGGSDGEEFDTFIGCQAIAPEITVKTFQPTNWEQLTLRGLALNGISGFTFFARKFAANGSRVANATAQHLSFAVPNGRAIPIDESGDESNFTDTLKIEAIALTDSTVPLTITASSAIAAPSS